MSKTVKTWSTAWEPLTPQGVATFARASLRRLLFVQLVVAILAGSTVAWFLIHAWFPVIRAAIQQLPREGEIRIHTLDWHGDSAVQLAESHLLGIAVDLDHSGRLGREPQLQVEFGRDDVRIFGLFGYVSIQYPPGWRMAFNRDELEPWWGAREPLILCGVGVLTVAVLMLSWTLLATLYFLPVKLISFFEDRELKLGQSWKLAGAALMPGALFFICVIIAYGLHWLDLISLGAFAGLHILIGWAYLFISPLLLERDPEAPAARANPFMNETAPGRDGSQNPFVDPGGPVEEKVEGEKGGTKSAE